MILLIVGVGHKSLHQCYLEISKFCRGMKLDLFHVAYHSARKDGVMDQGIEPIKSI